MKIFFPIFCFLITTSFLFEKGENFDFRKRAHVIARNAAKPLEKKYQLNLIGSGGGLFKDVEQISFDYQINKSASQEEARKMTVEFVEQIAKAFNDDLQIQPYLHDHPFAVQNISVHFFVKGKNQDEDLMLYPQIGSFGSSITDVYYQTWYFDNGVLKVKTRIEEPYEEAKKIVDAALFNGEEN